MHSSQRTIDDMMKISDNMMGCGFNTYKNIFNIKHHFPKNQSHTLDEISKLTGYKKKGLQTIYNKGVGAYHTNPLSVRKQVKSPEQWAMGRVYASINPDSKAYRVDKSHLIKGGMIGGMAKFNAEGQVVERKDEKNEDDEIEGITYEITDYIKSIDRDKNLSNLQKFKEIMKQIEDMNELSESTENEHEQEYINSLITYSQNILSHPKYNDFTNIDYYYKNVQGNPLFEKFQEEAKLKPLEEYEEDENINTIRGDISEDKIIEYDIDTGILEDYDGNKSTPYNSKELYGYNPEYIKKLLKKNNFYNPIEIEDADDELKNKITNTYLKYYPVDVIKDGTLWELKSFSKPTKTKGEHNYQEMQKTKIEGTPRYQILYKQLDNGDWVVGNVLDVKENKKTLPDRPNGYKYYWGYNSKDGIASANPLKSNNFRPDMNNPVVLKDGITYYKGGWNPTMSFKNDNGVDMIKITNKELKKEPRRYSYNYSKTIK